MRPSTDVHARRVGQEGWTVMRVTRIGRVFNHKGQKGILDISRSKGYRDYVLTDPANPNIPGTDIARLQLVHLGGKSAGVSDDEINRVILALQELYAAKAAQRAKRKNPPLGEVAR
jgi:hypothetical protein